LAIERHSRNEQNEWKHGMDKRELQDRFVDFGARVIRISKALPHSPFANHVGLQLLRAATSSGANHCEACGAESRPDFAHKLQLTLKELRETEYWLKLISRAELISPARLKDVMAENNELIAICVAAVRTAKSHSAKDAARGAVAHSEISNQ
jgi:four helix bundle protein